MHATTIRYFRNDIEITLVTSVYGLGEEKYFLQLYSVNNSGRMTCLSSGAYSTEELAIKAFDEWVGITKPLADMGMWGDL